MEFHIAEGHSWEKHISDRLDTIYTRQEQLAEVVLGTKVINFDGETVRQGGLAESVEGLRTLSAQASNGGVKTNIPWPKIIATISAIGTAVAALAAAFFESIPPTP